jgi:isocitrate dehydrogenase kinase/phosphatase
LLKQRGIYKVYKKLLENQDGYARTLMRILSKDDKYVEYENISRDLDRVLDMIDIESSSEEEVDDFIKGYIPKW